MLHIELSDLVFFQAVARHGGITHAAKKLHCVPSNVSTRIKQLESNVEATLFIREGKTLRLSSQGRTLLVYADRIIALATEAQESMTSSEPQGVLRLGSMDSLAATRLPVSLASYHQAYPKVKIELTLGSTKRLTDLVLAGELEAAVIAEPPADERLRRQAFTKETLIMVAAADSRPIKSPADIASKSIMAFPSGCAFRERLEAWFVNAELPMPRVIELTSYHAILGCVAAGMGVAFVPQIVLDGFADNGSLSRHRVPSKWSSIETALVWRDGSESARLRSFARTLKGRSK